MILAKTHDMKCEKDYTMIWNVKKTIPWYEMWKRLHQDMKCENMIWPNIWTLQLYMWYCFKSRCVNVTIPKNTPRYAELFKIIIQDRKTVNSEIFACYYCNCWTMVKFAR